MMRFAMLATGAALLLSACSTQVQNAASADFAPVYPTPAEELTRRMPSGGIYSETAAGLFAMDRRAGRVGDILTVEFTESFTASKSQNVATSRSDSFDVRLPGAIFGGFTGNGLNSGRTSAFGGTGAAAQSNALSGRVSVTVVRELPGGNLEILGQKKMTFNNGDEYVRLRGTVRPSDISADNVVQSDRIANAEIQYVGAGQVADAGKQGWLRQGLNTVSPF
ncbi:flagellar basal body L-ring protein FlgH [Pseudoprimorskyibacter insulae]|uniref:Flagellar L-ring protein n=1 Tax=Pseudoprimorskyibacter insulae TaxID=1695997 RepID=A0A2R8AW57_9RHOB|nr:flagellar basal body L-ring protein FlgH [Pseudoprimorskyibacter insulae]SPF80109.1 Flagellar L-ring protein [Pseudoprimorskyibacter insulae]